MRNASSRKPRLNIGYKFLIHPKNYESIVEGTVLAKNIGCDEIQFRPVYVDDAEQVMPAIVEQAQNSIMEARRMCEDRSFTVHGVMHKFGANWLPTHDFGSCTMTPLGLIFSADGNMYLCCDRRGDPKLKLGLWHDGKTARLDYIQNLWGSDKHRWLINQIKTSECPRCSFYFYNKAATEAFKEDYMNRNFL
jgi:sulfatase maturation enzyme AslB (radical SAM superfamily)